MLAAGTIRNFYNYEHVHKSMSFDRAGLSTVILALMLSVLPAHAQQPAEPGNQQPVQPAPGAQTAPSSAQQSVAPQPLPPPQEPPVLEDGGFSIEPMYWLNRAQPALFGGAQATAFGSLSYPGNANAGLGGEVSIPTGHSNTLRISYFRVQGNANQTATQSVTVFNEAYGPGDYLVSSYNIQSAKISWDYLSYTWRKVPGSVHFKTLYEMQYATIATNIVAPFKSVSSDVNGNVDENTATGSKSIFLPTFGMELEQSLGGKFRWEIKGSGFGIPHHSVIWDAQADIGLRFRHLELIAGEKAYYFKTSPQANQYFEDTLYGVFAGIRYYVGNSRR
jgi:hypothetical protein